MTKLLIDYIRPNGQPLRFVDLGMEFIESERIPDANVLQPFRDEAEGKVGATGIIYFEYSRLALPLPDGFETVLRIMGTTVTMNDEQISKAGIPTRYGKMVVAINDINYDVTVVLAKGRQPYWVQVHAHKAAQNSEIAQGQEVAAVGQSAEVRQPVKAPIAGIPSNSRKLNSVAHQMHCERCKVKPRIRDQKYCKDCKKTVLAELRESGYLTPKPFTPYRPPDSQEKVHETKHGTGHG